MKKRPFEVIHQTKLAQASFSNSLNSLSDDTPMAAMHPSQFGFRAVQRLSSYSLLLEKLVKKTSDDHIDYPKLKLAHSQVKFLACDIF